MVRVAVANRVLYLADRVTVCPRHSCVHLQHVGCRAICSGKSIVAQWTLRILASMGLQAMPAILRAEQFISIRGLS